ncbi:Rieske 2Fe-2S domain-containing protein [Nocardia stercoris]|uniref:Rieske-type oxygenase n=1 Tax=Nocardia stercoris TaxID=2483361 RepID=A0A3M2L6K6_9NOCA|nr:Rieske 2Fe-2S domain-containing protein [Nocardia stercoris]RMI32163.1 Rieske (2Fe-2S) protein [Nocardia stercoris]
MPTVPEGWYALLRSAQLKPGKIVNLHYFGRALIAYRGADGRATVRDAHCPHYGAHLGVGGRMVDGQVECPFHGWRFDGDGACVSAPFAARPPRVRLGGFPIREHSGLIFVYSGAGEPEWEVPEIPEATGAGYARPIDDALRARIHIQEMRENIVDESHFHYIHGQSEPPVQDLLPDGPFAEIHSRFRKSVLGYELDNSFDVTMYGPGVMVVRTTGALITMTAIALTNPVDDTTSELRMLYFVRRPAGIPFAAPVLKLAFRLVAFGEVREELAIWDHKIHRDRPVLLPHEKGIKALRRWYAQFYPPQAPAAETVHTPNRELDPQPIS